MLPPGRGPGRAHPRPITAGRDPRRDERPESARARSLRGGRCGGGSDDRPGQDGGHAGRAAARALRGLWASHQVGSPLCPVRVTPMRRGAPPVGRRRRRRHRFSLALGTIGAAAVVAAAIVAGAGGSAPPGSPLLTPARLPGELEGEAPWQRNVAVLRARLTALGLPALGRDGPAHASAPGSVRRRPPRHCSSRHRNRRVPGLPLAASHTRRVGRDPRRVSQVADVHPR
jgi:hypothetical protein